MGSAEARTGTGSMRSPKDEQLEEGFAVKGKEGSEGRKGRGWRLEA